jgi:phosphomannomutase
MRGIIANGLTPDTAIRFSAAYGSYLERGTIIVAHDSRISSIMLYNAVVSSLMSTGCQVILADLCTSPELSFLIQTHKTDGGILIGAGHHKNNWNAIIPFNNLGSYLNQIQCQEMLDIYHGGEFQNGSWQEIGATINLSLDYKKEYINNICKFIEVDTLNSKPIKVVVDFCNGPGSLLIKELQKHLKIEFIVVNRCTSGPTPHNPEPRPSSAYQVQSIVESVQADIGFVFNSNMSRFSIVTNIGKRLSEEMGFPLLLNYLLSKKLENKLIVTNHTSTRMIDDVVRKHHGQLIKTSVGESQIIDKIIETGAAFGGDGSGSFTAAHSLHAFDSFLAFLTILEAMTSSGKTIQELVDELPNYHIIKKNVPCGAAAHAYKLLKGADQFFPDAQVTEVDGIRFDLEEGWVHLRPSRTEPVIRMTVEHKNREKAEDLTLQVRGALERLVTAWR